MKAERNRLGLAVLPISSKNSPALARKPDISLKRGLTQYVVLCALSSLPRLIHNLFNSVIFEAEAPCSKCLHLQGLSA